MLGKLLLPHICFLPESLLLITNQSPPPLLCYTMLENWLLAGRK